MKIKEAELKKTAEEILVSHGAAPEESEIVADILVAAEMRGIKTHGLKFLPIAIERINGGLIDIPTELKVLNDDGAVTHMDGGNGLGQFAAAKSMQSAIDKAEKFGLGLTLTRNTNHIGILSYYSSMAAERGMVGICMSNSASAMAPWGGVEAFFGTNPFSVAVPRKENSPIVLDMSTSIVARGKIRYANAVKEKIPLGWAIDKEGNPTSDPSSALEGSLLPIGGPKGYGMALFIDIICGLLSGSSYGKEIKTFHKPLGPTGVGIMTMAVDIKRFMPEERFRDLLEEYVGQIKSSKKVSGNDTIYMPGEIEAERELENLKEGVELDSYILEQIKALLKEKNIEEIVGTQS